MKTFLFYIACFFVFMLFFSGCIVNVVSLSGPALPAETTTVQLIVVGLIAIYEVVVRVIPSFGDYSAISWFIKALKKLSDALNRGPTSP
jgi:hypothetical protein